MFLNWASGKITGPLKEIRYIYKNSGCLDLSDKISLKSQMHEISEHKMSYCGFFVLLGVFYFGFFNCKPDCLR